MNDKKQGSDDAHGQFNSHIGTQKESLTYLSNFLLETCKHVICVDSHIFLRFMHGEVRMEGSISRKPEHQHGRDGLRRALALALTELDAADADAKEYAAKKAAGPSDPNVH